LQQSRKNGDAKIGGAKVGDANVGNMDRLKRRSEFRAVAQAAGRGARAHASAFTVQVQARPQTGPARIGFTVAKQVGNAVERNRVRRRLREVVRLAPPGLLRAGHDYVLIGRRSALKAAFEDLVKELDGVVGRVHASGKTGVLTDLPTNLPTNLPTSVSDKRLPHRAGPRGRLRAKSGPPNSR
jgi:ribonuclease P protein component